MKTIIAQNFSHVAEFYDNAAILHQEIGARLLERLELIKFSPETILDLGCGTGYLSTALSSKYPTATIINLDISERMLHFSKHSSREPKCCLLCADGEHSPLKSQSVDFVFSNGFLQYFSYPQNVLEEIYRILKPNGLFLFSTFGPDTLKELRHSFELNHLQYPIQSFSDMHDFGDLMIKTGFLDPVMDTETLTLTYQTLTKLAEDLLHTECHMIPVSEPLEKAYQNLYGRDNILPATFEIIYGLGFVPTKTDLYQKDNDGIIRIAADHIPILE